MDHPRRGGDDGWSVRHGGHGAGSPPRGRARPVVRLASVNEARTDHPRAGGDDASRGPSSRGGLLDLDAAAHALAEGRIAGHLLIGGTDPAVLAGQVPDRIAHTHFKDVDLSYARQVQAGRLTCTEAVRGGMYRPLGRGDVDVVAIVEHLRGNGYDGWYTLEQDTILTDPPAGEGPVADVRTSLDYLRSLLQK